jgi:hypothetical protein
VYTFGRGNHG